jgi:hypothetical protein
MKAFALAIVAAAGFSAPAQATEYVYTKVDLKACKHTGGKAAEDYGVWVCPGYAGISVRISAGDQRVFVSYGPKAKGELANRETLLSFNGEGSTIEWRIDPETKKPFAAIMRWSTTVSDDKGDITRGQVLVVTRLGTGNVCHVAYVDGRANPDANELARKAADERARTFKCGVEAPDSVGKTGPGYSPRWLMH